MGALALALCLSSIGAHPDSFSRSEVRYGARGLELTVRVQVQSLAEVVPGLAEGVMGTLAAGALEAHADEVRAYLSERFRVAAVAADGALLPFDPAAWSEASVVPVSGPLDLPGGELVDVKARWPALDTAPQALELDVRLFLETSPQHRDLCQLFWLAEEPAANLFHAGAPTWRWPPARPAPGTTLRVFGALGLGRVARAWPHLAFVLALVLGAASARGAWLRVGAFAAGELVGLLVGGIEVLAHQRAERLLELAFVLSVAYAGADNLLHERASRRWIEAALFGVVHGAVLRFTLSGPLAALYHRELPLGAAFLGQILPLIAFAALILGLRARFETRPKWLVRGGSLVLVALGLVGFAGETLR